MFLQADTDVIIPVQKVEYTTPTETLVVQLMIAPLMSAPQLEPLPKTTQTMTKNILLYML